jgi:diketogulonate reductase-like aldo/keto reductase
MTLTTHTRQIPASGETIPVIGLGTWRSFDVGRGAAARAPLEQCLAAFDSLGGGMIDSSPMYGNAEQVVGDLVTSLGIRNRVFLATKVWTSGRQRGIEQMRDSIRKLRATPIDLMQVHNLVDVDTHLDTLRQWKAEGLVRYVGITHYTAHAHRDVARIIEREPLDFVQINYSVAEREAEQSILPLAAERKVAVIVNRPFGTGAALGPLRGKPVPPWAGELDCATWAQLLLKFVVSHPAVTCAIPATANVEHLRENMRAGAGPMPDEALRGEIVRAARAAR